MGLDTVLTVPQALGTPPSVYIHVLGPQIHPLNFHYKKNTHNSVHGYSSTLHVTHSQWVLHNDTNNSQSVGLPQQYTQLTIGRVSLPP